MAAALSSPLLLDDPALQRLAGAGFRFSEGEVHLVRYRWLLPPDWVAAATLPAKGRSGIEPLCGVGDRAQRFQAVLGVLRGCADPPHRLLVGGADRDARITCFSSRAGAVAERLERKGERTVVTTVHAFAAAGEPYRFFVAASGPRDDVSEKLLRTLGAALSLADALEGVRAGRLAG